VLKISRTAIALLLAVSIILIERNTVMADERVSVFIRNVAVLQPTGSWLPHRDIVIRHTTITSIEPAGGNAPPAKVVINGTGKFAIPGLFDNAVDVARMSKETAGLFVAYGVTSVRNSGGDTARVVEWRREIASGKFMGPRLLETQGNGSRSAGPIQGSNTGPAASAPGLALHDELKLMVSRGATAAEALRRATIESARFHGRGDDLGSIEINKIADVVILNEDPLADIANTGAIDAVVFRGEALTRAHLNLLISKAAAGAVRR
jgi:adenine deaminase